MKKKEQQFEVSHQQEIGQEEKKLAAIGAEKEQAYENNSAARAR
jgi:hypothetical protein